MFQFPGFPPVSYTHLPLPYQSGNLPPRLPGYPEGDLILGGASHLDAFSGYPVPTWLPGDAAGATTGPPEVSSSRSSRTKDNSPQITFARSG